MQYCGPESFSTTLLQRTRSTYRNGLTWFSGNSQYSQGIYFHVNVRSQLNVPFVIIALENSNVFALIKSTTGRTTLNFSILSFTTLKPLNQILRIKYIRSSFSSNFSFSLVTNPFFSSMILLSYKNIYILKDSFFMQLLHFVYEILISDIFHLLFDSKISFQICWSVLI